MRQVVLALCLVAVTARANHLSLKVASGYTDVVGRDACLGSSKIVIDRPLAAPGVQEPGLATYAGYLRIVEEKEDTTCPTDTSGKKYTDAELRAGSTFTIQIGRAHV